jgi:hypothetical protein
MGPQVGQRKPHRGHTDQPAYVPRLPSEQQSVHQGTGSLCFLFVVVGFLIHFEWPYGAFKVQEVMLHHGCTTISKT